MRESRDREICRAFKGMSSQQEIALRYNISKQRVCQILRANGLTRYDGGVHVRSVTRSVTREEQREVDLDARTRRRFGHGLLAHRALVGYGKKMMLAGASYNQTPIGAFILQRTNVRRTNVKWTLSLRDWWAVWQASGLWSRRGRGSHAYCLVRIDPARGYERGNVAVDEFISGLLRHRKYTKGKERS